MEHARDTTSRSRHQQAGFDVLRPPAGLLALEGKWLEAHAAQVGGLTAAFRHLVRLGILYDAAVACWTACPRCGSETDDGSSTPAAACAMNGLVPRLLNLMTWRRPGEPGGHGDGAQDDLAVPLPRGRVRRLIAQGRSVFVEWPHARAQADAGQARA